MTGRSTSPPAQSDDSESGHPTSSQYARDSARTDARAKGSTADEANRHHRVRYSASTEGPGHSAPASETAGLSSHRQRRTLMPKSGGYISQNDWLRKTQRTQHVIDKEHLPKRTKASAQATANRQARAKRFARSRVQENASIPSQDMVSQGSGDFISPSIPFKAKGLTRPLAFPSLVQYSSARHGQGRGTQQGFESWAGWDGSGYPPDSSRAYFDPGSARPEYPGSSFDAASGAFVFPQPPRPQPWSSPDDFQTFTGTDISYEHSASHNDLGRTMGAYESSGTPHDLSLSVVPDLGAGLLAGRREVQQPSLYYSCPPEP